MLEDASIDAMFAELGNVCRKFDGFLHTDRFRALRISWTAIMLPVTKKALKSLTILALTALPRRSSPHHAESGSRCWTLSYLERSAPSRTTMSAGSMKSLWKFSTCVIWQTPGPKVRAQRHLCVGPIRTLARPVLKTSVKCRHSSCRHPSHRDYGMQISAFLCLIPLQASGEVVHVDGGFSIAAMNELELK